MVSIIIIIIIIVVPEGKTYSNRNIDSGSVLCPASTYVMWKGFWENWFKFQVVAVTHSRIWPNLNGTRMTLRTRTVSNGFRKVSARLFADIAVCTAVSTLHFPNQLTPSKLRRCDVASQYSTGEMKFWHIKFHTVLWYILYDSHFVTLVNVFTARCTICQTELDQDHIGWKSWKVTARTISPTRSLFVAQRSSTYSEGNVGKFWGD